MFSPDHAVAGPGWTGSTAAFSGLKFIINDKEYKVVMGDRPDKLQYPDMEVIDSESEETIISALSKHVGTKNCGLYFEIQYNNTVYEFSKPTVTNRNTQLENIQTGDKATFKMDYAAMVKNFTIVEEEAKNFDKEIIMFGIFLQSLMLSII